MLKLVSVLTFVAIAHAGRFSFHHKKIFPEVKIIGGNDTDIKHHPWQVSLRHGSSQFCGGSLIANDWVVTAAHCADDEEPEDVHIKVGSTFQSSGGTTYEVKQIIVHPDWDYDTADNDIALVQLSQAVNDPIASFINLPSQGETLVAGTNLNITGWGRTKEYLVDLPEILQAVVIPVVSYDDCSAAYQDYYYKVTQNMICAGLMGVGGVDSCGGDSGGPAAKEAVLYGIVSWGNGCAKPQYPGVYTKVANYVDWIKSITGL